MVDKYQNIAHLSNEELQHLVKPCVFTEGTSKSRNGEPYRCKKGHITFMSLKGIDDIFAAMFRNNAKFTYFIYGKEETMKTGAYDFKKRNKSLLKRFEGHPKRQPCAVCFAKTRCMGTNAADVDALMTACQVKLLVEEAKHRKKIEAKAKIKKKRKMKKLLPKRVPALPKDECMFGETCARLKGSGNCLSGCPRQKDYERKLQEKKKQSQEKKKQLWQQEIQKKLEREQAARLLVEKQKQEIQEKKKREKMVRRRNFFASRKIQKMVRGYLVRKHMTQKAKEVWYSDLMKDKDLKGNNWPTILKELTRVEFDCEEIILDASVDDLVQAVLPFKLRKWKAEFLLKILKKRSEENHVIFMPSMTHHWSIMKQGPEPGLSPGSPGSPIGPPPGFAL